MTDAIEELAPLSKAAAIYTGPRGGRYVDPQHKIPYKPGSEGQSGQSGVRSMAYKAQADKIWGGLSGAEKIVAVTMAGAKTIVGRRKIPEGVKSYDVAAHLQNKASQALGKGNGMDAISSLGLLSKAKYTSRKRVGNKYVYTYADDKKGGKKRGASDKLDPMNVMDAVRKKIPGAKYDAKKMMLGLPDGREVMFSRIGGQASIDIWQGGQKTKTVSVASVWDVLDVLKTKAPGSLPQFLREYTEAQHEQVISTLASKPLKDLRRRQDIAESQSIIHNKKVTEWAQRQKRDGLPNGFNDLPPSMKATTDNLAYKAKHLQAAVDVSEFGDTTAADWAKQLVSKSGDAIDGLETLAKGGPYIGPRGGKWADAKHTIAWQDSEQSKAKGKGQFKSEKQQKAQESKEAASAHGETLRGVMRAMSDPGNKTKDKTPDLKELGDALKAIITDTKAGKLRPTDRNKLKTQINQHLKGARVHNRNMSQRAYQRQPKDPDRRVSQSDADSARRVRDYLDETATVLREHGKDPAKKKARSEKSATKYAQDQFKHFKSKIEDKPRDGIRAGYERDLKRVVSEFKERFGKDLPGSEEWQASETKRETAQGGPDLSTKEFNETAETSEGQAIKQVIVDDMKRKLATGAERGPIVERGEQQFQERIHKLHYGNKQEKESGQGRLALSGDAIEQLETLSKAGPHKYKSRKKGKGGKGWVYDYGKKTKKRGPTQDPHTTDDPAKMGEMQVRNGQRTAKKAQSLDEQGKFQEAATEYARAADLMAAASGNAGTGMESKSNKQYADDRQKKYFALMTEANQKAADQRASANQEREAAEQRATEATKTSPGIAEGHAMYEGKHLADTQFMNRNAHVLPGFSMEHMGFGEFYLKGPDGGRIDFARGAPDFPGKSGRSHFMYDNKEGALVEQLLAAVAEREQRDRANESQLLPGMKGYREKSSDAIDDLVKTDITQELISGKAHKMHAKHVGGRLDAELYGRMGSKKGHKYRGVIDEIIGKMKRGEDITQKLIHMVGKYGKGKGKQEHPVSEKQRRWAFAAEDRGELPEGTGKKWSRRAKGKGLPTEKSFHAFEPSLKKGLYAFEHAEKTKALPAKLLPQYLEAFVEQAYEHEKRECEHMYNKPTGQREQLEFFAKRIMNCAVVYVKTNPDLMRAMEGCSIETLCDILENSGLIQPDVSGYIPPDNASHAAMGAFGSPDIARSMGAAPFIQDDLVKSKEATLTPSEAASITDDRLDPFTMLQKQQIEARQAAFNIPEMEFIAKGDSNCPIHGYRDMTKMMNLRHPYGKCTCD